MTLVGPAFGSITGTVLDAETGEPLPDALVSVQASSYVARTNEEGGFQLDVDGAADLVIVAARKEFFNASVNASDGATNLVLSLERVPLQQNSDYVFREPNDCAACHFVQFTAWELSPMGQAGTNSWVADIYAGNGTEYGAEGFVYVNDSVHAAENPESECAACHQPEKWLRDPGSAIEPVNSELPAIAHGVSCEVCHKIANVDEGKPNFPGVHSAAVTMNLSNDPTFAVQYGVLGDTDYYEEGNMRPSYQPQLRAAVCGACHQDKNDHDADGDFEDEGGVISEPTYLEWLESPYSDPLSDGYADCVDCHMPPTGAEAACDQLGGLGRPEGDVRSHRILGTTPEFLENAVTLELETRVEDERLIVDVSITNDKTGHHVPTGVTIRNMLLLVEAIHEDGTPLEHVGGELVHELGGVGDPALGYYAGLPGKLFAKINEDTAGNSPTFFTDAIAIRADNRIPAGHTDESSYEFISPQGGIAEVRTRLIYRKSWRSLTDAKQWTTDGHGLPLADVQAPHYGHLMEEATALQNVPLVPECILTESCDVEAGGAGGEANEAAGGEQLPTSSPNDGNCGCHVPGTPGRRNVPLLLISMTMLLLRRRFAV